MVDIRRCNKCGRRSNLYGDRDCVLGDDDLSGLGVRGTGWEGWCRICNLEWKHAEIEELLEIKRRNIIGPVWQTSRWFISERLHRVLLPLVAVRLGAPVDPVSEAALLAAAYKAKVHLGASCKTWRRLLIPSSSSFFIQEADYVREADTDDVLSDGAFDAHLPFVNPIAKLALARDAEGNIKVFTLLCRFLSEHQSFPLHCDVQLHR